MTTARARRRSATWCAVLLLVAALGLAAAPPAAATGWRTTLALHGPGTVVAGVPFAVTVAAVGPRGRIDHAYRGMVRFGTGDTLARALPARYSFTRADRGRHTFTGVTLVGTGTTWLTVRDVRRGWRHDTDPVRVANAGAALEGQVLSELDPVEGGIVTVYDAVTGLAVGSGPADTDGYRYRITGLPAGAVKVGAVVPGPYAPDFANDRNTLAEADVFVLSPGATLVQSWEVADFGPYLDVRPLG
ncbi:hypothetical protein [Cellulomonas edaphi]|uniref:DUF4198 domain-containing protein n=1 Tax=Cellulomonas edaphi TaxID=3053468 RepID=A0ABT7S4X1_9CELL|nr:hypothetical protein [Cellulomons edaphi]MDM7830673.1 hypothetical protein [Cellulomons edaphi]